MIISNFGDKDEYWDKSHKLISKITLVHKKGPKNNVENYRPVANLSSTSKIFERLNSNLILEIEAENCTDITGKSQHSF